MTQNLLLCFLEIQSQTSKWKDTWEFYIGLMLDPKNLSDLILSSQCPPASMCNIMLIPLSEN